MVGVSFAEAKKMLEELHSKLTSYGGTLDSTINVLSFPFEEILVEITVIADTNTLFNLPVFKVDVKYKSLGDELVLVIDKKHNIFTSSNFSEVCDYISMLQTTHVVQIRGKYYIN